MEMETLPSGTKLNGRYRVERVLGNGGFGHVYLSIDIQSGQLFAIKEYLVTGAGGKAQLEHESHVLSQLHHASLPAFQDAFDERGRYYVVLGYIEGRDLTDCIRATRTHGEVVPMERILNWLTSICEAVTFLHNQRPPIIHRDIKPDNIRITPSGTAILVDLGNAKAAADGARTLLFIRHQGTPGYAPLEQYPGGNGTDSRSDVYALGGTLFFALTGHEPPSVSTRKQSSDQKLPDLPSLQEILQQNPPETAQDPNANRQFRLGINKPSKPSPRHSRHIAQLGALTPDLLNRLNLIIARAMAMDPWDRYQSVVELSADLQRVRAALPPSMQTEQAPVKRHIDPNSTQPDLQFAFETLQNERENAASPTMDSPAKPDRQNVHPKAPDIMARCPRCQGEVSRTAQFCPRCGTPLNNTSPQNLQENTPVINPPSVQARPNANPSLPVNTPKEIGNAFAPAQSGTQASRTQLSPGSNLSPQLITRASTPPPSGSKPVMQTVAQQPLVIPGNAMAQPAPLASANMAQPRAGAHTMQPSPPSPISFNQPVNAPQRAGSSKWLRYVVIALVVVVVIIVIILLVHGGKGAKHSGAAPLQQARYYAAETQVDNYERNISLCPASTTAHSGAGAWQCHTSIPAFAGIAQRVAGPRTGSAAFSYRSRLA
ncbi:MAG TPA: protein kinase [Ktedonobacteraceae bacterium]|nr:protein kinase [Ktedonobacteraceae bacterium]